MKTESQNSEKKRLNKYEKRWIAAREFFELFKQQVIEAGGTGFEYDGDYYPLENLIIGEKEIYLKYSEKGCNSQLFENDIDCDHGLHTPIKEFQEEFLDRVKIFKEVKIKLKNKRVRKECR